MPNPDDYYLPTTRARQGSVVTPVVQVQDTHVPVAQQTLAVAFTFMRQAERRVLRLRESTDVEPLEPTAPTCPTLHQQE